MDTTTESLVRSVRNITLRRHSSSQPKRSLQRIAAVTALGVILTSSPGTSRAAGCLTPPDQPGTVDLECAGLTGRHETATALVHAGSDYLAEGVSQCRRAIRKRYLNYVRLLEKTRSRCLQSVYEGRSAGPCEPITSTPKIERLRERLSAQKLADRCPEKLPRTVLVSGECSDATNLDQLSNCLTTQAARIQDEWIGMLDAPTNLVSSILRTVRREAASLFCPTKWDATFEGGSVRSADASRDFRAPRQLTA